VQLARKVLGDFLSRHWEEFGGCSVMGDGESR